MSKLSDTARAILTAASEHSDRLALPPERLPVAAQRSVIQSLLKAGLLEEVAADDDQPGWRTDMAGERNALRITSGGVAAVAPNTEGTEAASAEMAGTGPRGAEQRAEAPRATQPHQAAQEAPLRPEPGNTRTTLRAAAQTILAAWNAEDRHALAAGFEALRSALAARSSRAPETPRAPRTNTKQATVLAMLRRPEGASGPAMAEVTGWAPHTVRGFLAGLSKRGHTVTVLDRVRQVGPGKEGATGSYTVYRVAEAG